MSWLEFVVYGLATFRLTILLSKDIGPWGVFEKLRSYLRSESKTNDELRKSKISKGIECPWCVGIWIGLPISFFAAFRQDFPYWMQTTGDVFCFWMAMSSFAIILNQQWTKD